MLRFRIAGRGAWVCVVLLTSLSGCNVFNHRRPAAPPPADVKPTMIAYVDEDGFDRLLELALVNRDPAVVIETGRLTADWGPRLNAWIAAWNLSGHVRTGTARGQSPVKIDGESVREFRLLIDGLLDRIEEAGQSGSAWYRDQRERSRRVALLKPYNLRFHKGEDDTIRLIFFHESYSARYARFMQELLGTESEPTAEWTRSVECSQCAEDRRRAAKLVGRTSEP